jgi:hypothetical protein
MLSACRNDHPASDAFENIPALSLHLMAMLNVLH